jgi:hypothetical protein
MDSVKPLNLSFHLIYFSAMMLPNTTVSRDTNRTDITTLNHERNTSDVNICQASVVSSAMLDLKRMENKGYCHFKVCENKYGNRNGRTRNPDVIYRVICEETAYCKQAFLTMEVTLQKDGKTQSSTEAIPAGCIYSVTDLRDATEVNQEEIDGIV